ncbi:MAG: hypothetical protein ED559_08370 [Phycisphaera sp.]|nr:MAG: hypothetical protein ED559_08370 [Phycisphaera sp.]
MKVNVLEHEQVSFRSDLDMGAELVTLLHHAGTDRSKAMTEHIDQTIADLRTLLKKQEDQVRGTKRTINSLLGMAGKDPMYSDAELAEEGASASFSTIASDRWYGQPLATAIQDYLSMRRAATGDGPATVAEIYDALLTGGYEFEAKNADYAKRGLRSSLTKNPRAFHRLPDGKRFGLTEWYPKKANKTATDPAESGDRDSDESSDQDGGDE